MEPTYRVEKLKISIIIKQISKKLIKKTKKGDQSKLILVFTSTPRVQPKVFECKINKVKAMLGFLKK